MREVIGLDKQRPLGPGWLAIPFLIFAVVSSGSVSSPREQCGSRMARRTSVSISSVTRSI